MTAISRWDLSGCKAHEISVFSKIETDKICRHVYSEGIELKLFLDNGDQHVSGHGATDVRLHRVLAEIAKTSQIDPSEFKSWTPLSRPKL